MIKKLLKKDPFKLDNNSKKEFLKNLIDLTKFHKKKCKSYLNIIKNTKFKFKKNMRLYDLPFLPASLFKEIDLYSINKKKIFKTLKSSGTSGANVSKIFLDKENDSATFKETFINDNDKSIRQNNHTLYMDTQKNMLQNTCIK